MRNLIPTINEIIKYFEQFEASRESSEEEKNFNNLNYAISMLPAGAATMKETIKTFKEYNKIEENRNVIYNNLEYAIVQLEKKLNTNLNSIEFLIWPMAGDLGSRFGEKRINSKGNIYYHQGQDIKNKPPTDKTHIVAAASGVVIFAFMGNNGNHHNGYGNCIDIRHNNGMITRYAHCSTLNCKVGDKVKQGEFIAIVGSTGHSTGPHLHFELIEDGKQINPVPYLPSR